MSYMERAAVSGPPFRLIISTQDININYRQLMIYTILGMGPSGHWYTSTKLHGVTSQKTILSCIWSVTTDGFLTDDWILFDTLHEYTLQFTSAHSHIFTAVTWQQLPIADDPLPLGSWTSPGLS
jgi:hypothetical protein